MMQLFRIRDLRTGEPALPTQRCLHRDTLEKGRRTLVCVAVQHVPQKHVCFYDKNLSLEDTRNWEE